MGPLEDLDSVRADTALTFQFLEAMGEASIDPIWATDANGMVLFANSAAERLTGVPRQDMIGRPGAEFDHWPEQGRSAAEATALATGVRQTVFGHYVEADGSVRHYRLTFSPLRDPARKVVGLVAQATDITASQASAAMLEGIASSLPGGIYAVDRDLRVTYANDWYVRALGKPRDQIIGRTFYELWPERREEFDNNNRDILATGKPEIRTLTYERPEGPPGIWRVHKFALRAADGEVVGLAGVVHDHTAEFLAAQAQEQSEQRFRAISLVTPNIIWSSNAQGVVDFISDQWFEFTGEPPAEPDAAHWHDLVHPDDRASVLEKEVRLRRGETVGESTFRLRHHSGEYRTMLARQAAAVDPATGVPQRYMGSFTDIQDQVDGRESVALALAEAEAHKAHLQSILQSVPDAMIVIDHRGTIQSFSPSAEQMFGWRSDEVVGRELGLLMPEPYRSNHMRYIERRTRTGTVMLNPGRVLEGLRNDGSTFPVELSLGVMQSGGLRYFTGFLRDLSERRAAERRFQGLQDELVQVSRLCAMGEMAAGMAHELNQPLMAAASYVQGSARLLERDDPPLPAVTQALRDAGHEILRAGEIIRKLRRYVSQGIVERRPEALEPMLREAAGLAMIGRKDSAISVRYRIPAIIPKVLVDRVQVQQVVLNLVRNAVEAMAEAVRRELTISASLVSKSRVEVAITDTGPGIADSVASELFHPFVSTKAAGMGVGLSISKTIIEAQGGKIWAEPRKGGGTVFRFTLKAAPPEEESHDPNA